MKNKLLCLAILFSAVFFSARLSTAQNTDTCKRWHGWLGIRPTSAEEYKMQYDTLRHYIESCGKNDDSYQVFGSLDAAVQGYAPGDTSRYETYRNWLFSVLYLNTTQPFYFCACLQSIASTYVYSKFGASRAPLTILKYLRSVSACNSTGLNMEIKSDSISLVDSRGDTTLPTMDQLGLGFILHHSDVTTPVTPLPSQYLASFTSSPNPFVKETTLQFTLNRMTYTTVSIYDELGRLVWGDGGGSSLEAGLHTIHVDASSFPSGTLYARISTGFGEVKTVKLVKEK